MKEIHFYEGIGSPQGCLHSWKSTQLAITAKMARIDTTQMSFLSTWLLTNGYRVFIHPEPKSGRGVYEIKLGKENACTDMEITFAHNLFRLWNSGVLAAPREPAQNPTPDDLAVLRAKYPAGTRLRLKRDLEDPYATHLAGELATVREVDGVGQIHCAWDCGGSLALDADIDSFDILPALTPRRLQIKCRLANGVFFEPVRVGRVQISVEIGPFGDDSWAIWGALASEYADIGRNRTILETTIGALDEAIEAANKLFS